LKYRRSAILGCKDIGIVKLEFVAKTQYIYANLLVRTTLWLFSSFILRTSIRKSYLSG